MENDGSIVIVTSRYIRFIFAFVVVNHAGLLPFGPPLASLLASVSMPF
jgi:hypothetical protein